MFDGWVYTGYRLRYPLIVVAIPGEQQALHDAIGEFATMHAEHPNALAAALEHWLAVVTEDQFPGVVVMGLSFDLPRLCWFLLLSHTDFPRSLVGCSPPQWGFALEGVTYRLRG